MYQIKITGGRLKIGYYLKEILLRDGKEPIDFLMTTGKGQIFETKKEVEKTIKIFKKLNKPYSYDIEKIGDENNGF